MADSATRILPRRSTRNFW